MGTSRERTRWAMAWVLVAMTVAIFNLALFEMSNGHRAAGKRSA
jgi:hypothetical protein